MSKPKRKKPPETISDRRAAAYINGRLDHQERRQRNSAKRAKGRKRARRGK